MKIKTFVYQISNGYGQADIGPGGVWGNEFNDYKHKLVPAKDIDKEINKFITNKDVVSISVQYPTVNQHNNGGFDTVMAVYTIVYNEKAKE